MIVSLSTVYALQQKCILCHCVIYSPIPAMINSINQSFIIYYLFLFSFFATFNIFTTFVFATKPNASGTENRELLCGSFLVTLLFVCSGSSNVSKSCFFFFAEFFYLLLFFCCVFCFFFFLQYYFSDLFCKCCWFNSFSNFFIEYLFCWLWCVDFRKVNNYNRELIVCGCVLLGCTICLLGWRLFEMQNNNCCPEICLKLLKYNNLSYLHITTLLLS